LIVINIKKCNFQNISAFVSQSHNRYYLTHFDCYLKSRADENAPKILTLLNLNQASIQPIQNSPTIDSKSYKKVGRKPYFVTVEGLHPISSYLLFKIDRVCHALEHSTQVFTYCNLEFLSIFSAINFYRLIYRKRALQFSNQKCLCYLSMNSK